MLSGGAACRSQSRPHHHRNFPLPSRHVVDLGCLVGHLVHGEGDEISEHDVNHGAKAGHRGAHGQAGEAGFGNRCINHALGTELFYQPRQNFERRARLSHILAENTDTRIAAHFFRQRFADCLREGQFAMGSFRHTRPAPLLRDWDMELLLQI